MQHVSFRARTDPPTKTGWYYGMWKDPKCMCIPMISPRLVYGFDGRPQVIEHFQSPVSVNEYYWYGPVTEVQQASGEKL